MSVGQCVRAAARVSASMTYRAKLAPPTLLRVNEVLQKVKPPPVNFNKVIAPHQISILPHVICMTNAPSPKRRIEILDPLADFWSQKKTPTRQWGHSEISLPNTKDEELIEPPQKSISEKRAARLIVIRRAKMKKHKWRKLQKKMKFEFAKKRQKKELKKEKAFQAMLLAQVKKAEQFEAEEYVASRIKTAHWEQPITRVRGIFAPDWVIKDHLRAEEEKRRINERIQDCLRFKK